MLNLRQIYLYRLFVLTLLAILGAACLPTNNVETSPPVVAAYLEKKIILFECLSNNACFPNIDISDHVKSAAPLQRIDRIFYIDPSNVFITWQNGTAFQALRFNPKTGQVDYLDLPTEINAGFMMIASHGNVVLANRVGEHSIWIINEDLTIQKVGMPLSGKSASIVGLIEAPSPNIIAVNGSPIEKDGKIFAEVFIIDTVSGTFTQRLLDIAGLSISSASDEAHQAGDKDVFRIVNVSPDLKQLYVFYYQFETSDKANLILGAFDTQDLREVASTNSSECINFMVGYSQYRNRLYSSRADTEGSSTATLIGMPDLQSLIDLWELTKNGITSRITITPFDNHFLVGTVDRVYLIALDGQIVKEYTLPQDWAQRDYILMEYRK